MSRAWPSAPTARPIAAGFGRGVVGSFVEVGGVVLWDVAGRKRLSRNRSP